MKHKSFILRFIFVLTTNLVFWQSFTDTLNLTDMRKIVICLIIGAIAGIIDIIPMIVRGIDLYSCASSFIHWMVAGLIIPYVSWKIKPWLKGLIIAILTALPLILLVAKDSNNEAIASIIIFSVILGIFIGIAGDKFGTQ